MTTKTENDTQYQCTVCGRIGSVGRCCGLETRILVSDFPPLPYSSCKCQNWCRDGQKIITKHHPRCTEYSLESDAHELITDLLRGIEAWSSDEDGVHPECWEAYKRAKAAVWEMHDVHGEGF